MKSLKSVALISLMAFAATASAYAAPAPEAAVGSELAKAVREKLERLPYYGVFDLLTYRVDDAGVVELGGFVFRDSLKGEAEKAVMKVPGIKGIQNKIEDLDWGVQDDEIRARVYLSIYRDSFLSRYGTITDMALANGVRLPGRGSVFGPVGIGNPFFPGFNPAGDYGIHILVSNGEVILVGTVDNEGDKNLAGMKARGVFPVKKVFNDLSVKNPSPKADPTPAPPKRGIIVETIAP